MVNNEDVVNPPPPPRPRPPPPPGGNPPAPKRETFIEEEKLLELESAEESSTSNTESSQSNSSESVDFEEEDSDAADPESSTLSKSKSKKSEAKSKYAKPKKPKMGRLVYVGRGQYEAQVGGVPDYKWNKIAKLPQGIHTNNYLMRSQSSKKARQDLRQKGIDLKLKSSVSYSLWAMNIVNHAKQHGMETTLYVQKPSKKTTMINVALQPGFFTSIKAIEAVVAEREPHLDNYDKANDEDLRQCIFNSISPSLLRRLQLQQPKYEQERVAVIMVRLSHIHGKHDSAFIEAQEKKIERRLPSHYTGENIVEMNMQTLEDALPLEYADKYRPELTLKYLRNLLQAGGEPSVDNPGRDRFCRRLWPLEDQLEKALQKTSHWSYASQARYFARKNLTLQDICETAEEIYNELYFGKIWYPSRLRQDSRAPPRNFGPNVVTLNGDASSAVPTNCFEDRKCYNCGQPGHLSRNCPSPMNQGQGQFRNIQGGSGRGKHKGQGNKVQGRSRNQDKGGGRGQGQGRNRAQHPRDECSWNFAPPQPGQPQRRMYKGKFYSWCDYCNKWVTSHGTDSHNDERLLTATS